MASVKPRRQTFSETSPHAVSLAELLGAISREFVTAAASHHATMSYWQKEYENNAILSDYQPLGMKIVSAQLSLPVAIAQIAAKPSRTIRISRTMIERAILSDITKVKRQEVARTIHAELSKDGKDRINSSTFLDDVEDVARKILPNNLHPINRQLLEDFRQGFLMHPAGDSKISLLYRAKDIEGMKGDVVFRINLELKLE